MPSTFINQLAEHIKTHYNLQNEELTVVFPNKRAAFYLRTRFKELFQEDIWLPQMLSIQEAMTQWSGLRLVDGIDMMFELVAIDAESFHNNNSISIFGSMATQMADDFNEIDQYAVDADHLFSYIYDERKIGIWKLDSEPTPKEQQYLEFYASLKTYYHELRKRLEQQGKGYYGMITRHLADLPETELLQRIGNRKVLFAGFNALTPTEQTIIDSLYSNGQAEVIWDFDRYYIDDSQNEAGFFARRYIKENLPWKPVDFSDQLQHGSKEIHLIGVKGKTIQAKALQSLLQVEDEVNTAVILADESLIIPVLNSIPDSQKYPSVRVSMGYPLQQTSLNHFVTAFFTLHRKGHKVAERGWYLWPILRILDLELVKVIFTDDEIHQLEQYRELIGRTSRFIFTTEDFDHCCKSEDLQQFIRLLLGMNGENAAGTPQELLDCLVEMLAFIANKIQNDDTDDTHDKLFLLNQVSETGKAVNRLRDITERHRDYIHSLADLETLFRLVSRNLAVKLNSSAPDGLQIMGLLEARNLDFDTFYMLGVNEGVLPIDKSSGSFIPNHIRRECHLPDYQEKQAVYAYHFYRQLQGAKRVYYLYDTSGQGNGGEPSRFLLQLTHELSEKNSAIKLIEETFANKTEMNTLPDTLKATKTESVMEALKSKIETEDPSHALAPTSISTFIQCPLHFFLEYVMHIKEHSLDEETQSNVIGTIVHKTLELVYQNYRNTMIDKDLFNKVIKPSVSKAKDTVINEDFQQGLSDVGYNYLDKLQLDKLLKNYTSYEEKQLSQHTLEIKELEYQLKSSLVVNGKSYIIAGKADRIDHYDGSVRIVDYKTGGASQKDVVVPQNINSYKDIPRKAMQLLIYKYLYMKEHQARARDVTACLFALRNQQVQYDLQINNEALNTDFLGTMEQLLTDILVDMTNPEKSFDQTDNYHSCRYCNFTSICANTAIASRWGDGR